MTGSKIVQPLVRSAAWMVIGGLSVYFFIDNVAAYLFGYRSQIFGETLFQNQLFVVSHLAGGSITLLLGPFQFFGGLRKRFIQFHRISGFIYLAGAAVTGLSALRLSTISPCYPCRISLLLLSVLMLFATFLAWHTIRNGRVELHRKFMVRSYVLLLSFVMVRLEDLVSFDFIFGLTGDPVFRRVMNEYFFSFVPLIITEIFLTWAPAFRNKAVFQ